MDQNTNTRIDWRELATEGWISADRLEPFSPGALNARVKMAANREEEEEVSAWRWWWRGIRLRAQRPGREHDQGPVGGVGTEHFFFGGGVRAEQKTLHSPTLECHKALLTNLDCIHLLAHCHTSFQQVLTQRQSAREKLEGGGGG